MSDLFNANPFSGLVLTIGAYWVGLILYKKTKWTMLQPILTSSILIIAFLLLGGINYEDYYVQNTILNYLLPLTAVVLAVPLYKNFHILKNNALPIIAGITTGTIVTIISIVLMGKLMGTNDKILVSMLPKSATNPIAIEVSEIIGGIPSMTTALVVITGLIGAVLGSKLLNLMRIKNPVARGIALGSMSHALGTVRAFKEGETEGSMSSLAMALAGTLTAVIVPLVVLLI